MRKRKVWGNTERIKSASHALRAFGSKTGQDIGLPEDRADAVNDLLCNLMHYCARHNINFMEKLRVAKDNFEIEHGAPDDGRHV